MVFSDIEREVFGSKEAFSQRWAKDHGMPDIIPADPQRGIYRAFSPAEVFSEIAETGLSDQPAWYRASLAIEASSDKKFRIAARNGLLRLIALDHAMSASRIDSVVKILQTEMGISPQGVAQWLLVDQETRRCLALIFKLQGYKVAEEEGVHDEIKGLSKDGKLPDVHVKFSDFQNIRSDEIRKYLDAVQETVGTDPGIVRLAFAIFRYLGFPHDNEKFKGELIRKYWYDGRKGDLSEKEVGPFVDRLRNPQTGKLLKEVLVTLGVLGLTQALNQLPAEKITREWLDLQTMLDMMDSISDIRRGTGAAANIDSARRLEALRSVKEFGVLMAKRKLTQGTVDRILDLGKISRGLSSTDLGFWQKTIYGMKVPLGRGKKPRVDS